MAMMNPPKDEPSSVPVAAIAFAENLAKSYAARGGSVIDLFAAFAGIVVEQDKKVGLAALEATDRYLSLGSETSERRRP
jgi:hypothetical protein